MTEIATNSDSCNELAETIEPVTTDDLTLDEVWCRRDDLIHRGFESAETTLIEALPVSGKSYGVIKWAAHTEKPLTVFAPRHDLLNEYENRCEEFNLDFERLPSFYRDCESFDENGEPVDYAARELKSDYRSGQSGVKLHAEHSGLACQAQGECPFVENRDFAPDGYDVLLGTYRHAYATSWTEDRYIAFDEFPGDAFLRTFENGIAPVISAYVDDYEEELPFRDYTDFLHKKDDPKVQSLVEQWKSGLSSWSYDYKHVRQSPSSAADALAPIALLAVNQMETLDNGWGYSDLGYGRVAVRNPKTDKWTFHLPPDLSGAKSVLGLDGTPNETLWGVVLDDQIQTLSLLGDDERETYLVEILGYRFILTTESWKAIQSGEGAAPPTELALIEGAGQTIDQQPALISSQKAIRQYRAKGLDELTDTVKHYNSLKGINEFGKERLGIVLGNPHPGDGVIEMWAALAGESAQRKTDENGEPLTGNDTDYGPFGNEVMHTLVHDEVLQAAMRFGRDEVEGERGATVYLHTSAVPPWLPVEKQILSIQSWLTEKNGMKQTVEAIRSLEGWKNEEWRGSSLYDLTSISNRWVRDCLDDLADEGYISFERRWGPGQAKHYTNSCLEDAGNFGHVEFPE